MRKSLAAVAGLVMLAGVGNLATHSTTAQAGDDDVAAMLLSLSFSGAGEWYNAGFEGGFPIVECIVGYICPCVKIASIIDAAAGKTDDGLRFDFWASP